MKRVVLVDDHISVREMLASLLRREPGFEIAGEAATGLQALSVCRSTSPEIVIIDLVLPELCGTEVTRRLRTVLPETRVLVFSGSYDRQRLAAALHAKPHGLVLKSDPLDMLREAVRVVARGGCYFTSVVASMLHEVPFQRTENLLTEREREILQLIAESCSTKEIASRLEISPKTVENHRQHLMEKLRLHDVAALTRYAVRQGIVDISS